MALASIKLVCLEMLPVESKAQKNIKFTEANCCVVRSGKIY
jgi:hypothetical protein